MNTIKNLIYQMRQNPFIREKELGNGLSSFNFTRQAFYDGHWDEQTIKARGLFIDTVNNKVICRGYPKFFRYGEQGIDIEYLNKNIKFPVSVYKKENGFLGLFTSMNGEPLFATKSQIEGPYNEYFKNCMKKCLGDKTIELLRRYCEENDCTILFEVVDMINDPHIIEYEKPYNVFLLDIVKNDIEFSKLPYNELIEFGKGYKIEVKKRIYSQIETILGLSYFVDRILYCSSSIDKQFIEGFVIEDSNGFMFKLKTPYYSFWKQMRGIAGSVVKYGDYKHLGRFKDNEEAIKFYEWMMKNKDNDEIKKLVSQNRIIEIRKLFEH